MPLLTLALTGQLKQDTFPDLRVNYDKTIVEPCKTQGGEINGYTCVLPPPPPEPVYISPPMVEAPYAAPTAVTQATNDSLVGSIGYALSSGNCVLEVPIELRPPGNPETWAVTTQTPYIGGFALFPYNHVSRIVGLWSNGDVEVAQQNWGGAPITRFPRSTFRGYR